MKARVIALYLPQYHPTPDNDKWWGKGFTEWTNVGKAKPLFRGHYQPRVPADLGYYDLRLPEVRQAQADMAREAGIEAFCYYHYWFGNGKMELERPFEEVLQKHQPDFPFCLSWANASWSEKMWRVDRTLEKKILVEQLYPGDDDIIAQFNYLLPAFKDRRYMCVNNKPIFMVYNPLFHPNIERYIDIFRSLAKENGLEGIYLVGQTFLDSDIENIYMKGFDAVNICRLYDKLHSRTIIKRVYDRLLRICLKRPLVDQYKNVIHYLTSDRDKLKYVIPTMMPNWDHTPRSGSGGYVFHNSTPKLFKRHVEMVLETIKDKSEEERLVFIKSWNEWGEGNHLEPDLRYGMAYLEKLKEVLKDE